MRMVIERQDPRCIQFNARGNEQNLVYHGWYGIATQNIQKRPALRDERGAKLALGVRAVVRASGVQWERGVTSTPRGE